MCFVHVYYYYKRDGCGFDSIFSFSSRSRNETKRGTEFRNSTRNASKIRQKVENGSMLTPGVCIIYTLLIIRYYRMGSHCSFSLPCYVRGKYKNKKNCKALLYSFIIVFTIVHRYLRHPYS